LLLSQLLSLLLILHVTLLLLLQLLLLQLLLLQLLLLQNLFLLSLRLWRQMLRSDWLLLLQMLLLLLLMLLMVLLVLMLVNLSHNVGRGPARASGARPAKVHVKEQKHVGKAARACRGGAC
jgi:hypothetical protein